MEKNNEIFLKLFKYLQAIKELTVTNLPGPLKQQMAIWIEEIGVLLNILKEDMKNCNKIYTIDFKEVCDNLFDGIYVSDGKGNTLYVNDSYAEDLGMKKEDIIGKNVKDLEHIVYEGSVTLKVIKQKSIVNSLGYLIKTDKKILVTGIPLFDEKNNVRLVVISTRDVSELKQMEEIVLKLKKEKEIDKMNLRYIIDQQVKSKNIIYESNSIKQIMKLISYVGPTDANVLITGETGTGKELIANAIYSSSNRFNQPYVKVNCAAIPKDLLESELFGYESGAFTGASKQGKIGMFEMANNGTILLDEIGDMNIDLQAKLLRVLQEKEVQKIGGTKPVHLNIRLITSTNKDLKKEVSNNNFREDLFYRLNVVPINIPPLRERPEDIEPLARHFINYYNKKYNRYIKLTKDAIKILSSYRWPGNIRELENIMERMVVSSPNGQIHCGKLSIILNLDTMESIEMQPSLKERLDYVEKKIILEALSQNISLRQTASKLGISPSSLSQKCKKYEINLNHALNKINRI